MAVSFADDTDYPRLTKAVQWLIAINVAMFFLFQGGVLGSGDGAVVVQLGGVVCADCTPPGAPRVAPEVVVLLGALLTGDWAHAETTEPTTRSRASGVVAAYTQFHLERGLRSLEHVTR